MTYQITSLADYKETYAKSIEDPEGFWDAQAKTFDWIRAYDKVLTWDFEGPDVRWFEGGKLNITANCLDRHVDDKGDDTAIIWEPSDPQQGVRSYTYIELLSAVCKVANALKANGIQKGDRVVFYMPMVPELAIGLLACARIGAVHSVVFAGFSAQALADRINDAQAKMVICSDYNNRGAKVIAVKDVVDEALALGCPSVEHVLMDRNTGGEVAWTEGIDLHLSLIHI